jgi:hypothetical protein
VQVVLTYKIGNLALIKLKETWLDIKVACNALSVKSTLVLWLRKFDYQLSAFPIGHDHVKVKSIEQCLTVKIGGNSHYVARRIIIKLSFDDWLMSNRLTFMICEEHKDLKGSGLLTTSSTSKHDQYHICYMVL